MLLDASHSHALGGDNDALASLRKTLIPTRIRGASKRETFADKILSLSGPDGTFIEKASRTDRAMRTLLSCLSAIGA